MKIIAKGFQNGAEIDAKTHQKSMPELVSKKIREIIMALVGITYVKGTSVIEKETKKGDSGYFSPEPFLINFQPKSQSNIDAKNDVEKT